MQVERKTKYQREKVREKPDFSFLSEEDIGIFPATRSMSIGCDDGNFSFSKECEEGVDVGPHSFLGEFVFLWFL